MYRWHKDKPVMFRRAEADTWRDLPLGYWRKRHPLDCGHTKCFVCHSEKYYPDKNRANNERDAIRDWNDNGWDGRSN